jgi:hypothetical protein
MANPVFLKRSSVAGKVPQTTDLQLGELAINTNDGRLFFKKNSGSDVMSEIVALVGGQFNNAVKVVNGLTISQLLTPSAPSGTASASGGTILAGSYYARIVAVDAAGGWSLASTDSAAVVTTGSTSQITWSWAAVPGAASYLIWVGTTAGAQSTYFTSTTTSVIQTTPTGTNSTMPTVNSTSANVLEGVTRIGTGANSSYPVSVYSTVNATTPYGLVVWRGAQSNSQNVHIHTYDGSMNVIEANSSLVKPFYIKNVANEALMFGTNNTERGRFSLGGKFLLGTTTDNGTDMLQVNGSATATVWKSTVATGTAPLTVASSTVVTNLNADMVDGKHSTDFPFYVSMQGGKTYTTHDFSTYINVYETKFVNFTGSTNIPAGAAGMGYLFGMGGGDSAARGFELFGTSQNVLMFRERSNGTWNTLWHSGNLQASSTTPLINGTAAIGTSTTYARADHAHPTDTTRAPLASPTFTGIVTLPAGSNGPGLLGSTSNAVTAAGTTQGTATALTSDINIVTTSTAGTGLGVVSPGATSGKYLVIVNRSANAINVYPAAGHQFDGLGADTPISLPVNGFLEMYGSSTSQWHTTTQAITQASFLQGIVSIAQGGTGSTTATGALTALLPSLTGNSGKVLGTDGTNVSWVVQSGGGSSAAAATGGGTDKVFLENDNVVTTSYSITTNRNAMTAGPITINTGAIVTVPTGSVWTIV